MLEEAPMKLYIPPASVSALERSERCASRDVTPDFQMSTPALANPERKKLVKKSGPKSWNEDGLSNLKYKHRI